MSTTLDKALDGDRYAVWWYGVNADVYTEFGVLDGGGGSGCIFREGPSDRCCQTTGVFCCWSKTFFGCLE